MCDTLVKRTSHSLFFGKNSDRSPNEPNLSLFVEPKDHLKTKLKCTYIQVDQIKHSYGLVLSCPSWMWGAEMGINDQGVMIGNEAVFTKSKGKKKETLIGMDFLRLALERSSTAKEAITIIVDLLEKYGQGGNCGFDKHFYYDNSYLISDKTSSYILETSGKSFIVKEVSDFGNISNRLSINNDSFAKRNSEPIFTHFSGSFHRSCMASSQLKSQDSFDESKMMTILRSHYEKDTKSLYTKGSLKSVCMHKSFLGDQTTASMIVHSRPSIDTIWLTGSSTPCLSIYKPTFFGICIPPVFTSKEKSLAYWLEREYLVRAIFSKIIDEDTYKQQLNALQLQFVKEENTLFKSTPTKSELKEFAKKCSIEEQSFVNQYLDVINQVKENPDFLKKPWNKLTHSLGKNVFKTNFADRNQK
ncbi:MAG: peptidase U34 [Firmicutes bacterium]|nr:peptidase U34 [Bacillota bacterium]